MPTEKLVYSGDLSTPRSYVAAMTRDCDPDSGTACDGVLTAKECKDHMASLEREAYHAQYRNQDTDLLEREIGDTRRLLDDLKRSGANGILYLPRSCHDLPPELRQRATEVMRIDDESQTGCVDMASLAHARARYEQLGRQPAANAQRESRIALAELDAIAAHLQAYWEKRSTSAGI